MDRHRDPAADDLRRIADERRRVTKGRTLADKGEALSSRDDRSVTADILDAVYRALFIRTKGRMTPAILDALPVDLVLETADIYAEPPPK